MVSLTPKTKLLGAAAATAVGLFCFTGTGPAAQPMQPKLVQSVRTQPQETVPVTAPAQQLTSAPVESSESNADLNDLTGQADAVSPIEGFTEPYADIDLAASEMGILGEVLVKDGDVVSNGDLLAKLNDDVLMASLDVAKSAMSATGELQSAQAQLDLKQVEAKKLAELFDRNHASQKEIDRVAGEVRIATSRLLSVKEDLAVRKLEYARIEAQIKQRQIRSTIDGVVVDVRKDKGEFVSPSDPVVARVVQLDPLLVVFSVPNAYRKDVQKNQQVSMKIVGTGLAEGTVEHVSPTADASSGTFKVKVRLPNPGHRWHGGEKSELLLNADQYPKQIARNTK